MWLLALCAIGAVLAAAFYGQVTGSDALRALRSDSSVQQHLSSPAPLNAYPLAAAHSATHVSAECAGPPVHIHIPHDGLYLEYNGDGHVFVNGHRQTRFNGSDWSFFPKPRLARRGIYQWDMTPELAVAMTKRGLPEAYAAYTGHRGHCNRRNLVATQSPIKYDIGGGRMVPATRLTFRRPARADLDYIVIGANPINPGAVS
jgi:hypothetical protein